MPSDGIETLFDEFVDRYVSGANPDVRDYLTRAGAASDKLGSLIDRFLEAAPVQEPEVEAIVAMNVRLNRETVLTAARIHQRLKVDELVERLRATLGLPDSTRQRLRQAYQELEGEQLNPAGVHQRVWDALQGILHMDIRRLPAATTRRQAFAEVSYARMADFDREPAAIRHASLEMREPDEVDRLFRGHV